MYLSSAVPVILKKFGVSNYDFAARPEKRHLVKSRISLRYSL